MPIFEVRAGTSNSSSRSTGAADIATRHWEREARKQKFTITNLPTDDKLISALLLDIREPSAYYVFFFSIGLVNSKVYSCCVEVIADLIPYRVCNP